MSAVLHDILITWNAVLAIFLVTFCWKFIRIRARLYRRNKRAVAALRSELANAIARERNRHACYELQLLHWHRAYNELKEGLRK